jgi:hypothetical protein
VSALAERMKVDEVAGHYSAVASGTTGCVVFLPWLRRRVALSDTVAAMFCSDTVFSCFKAIERFADRVTGAAGPFFVGLAVVLISSSVIAFCKQPLAQCSRTRFSSTDLCQSTSSSLNCPGHGSLLRYASSLPPTSTPTTTMSAQSLPASSMSPLT